jgi:hypothetical protein
MKQRTKFSQKREHSAEQQTQAPAAKEFSDPDELLCFDAAQTTVPPEIAVRLQQSAGNLPGPKTNWWKRFFGGANL